VNIPKYRKCTIKTVGNRKCWGSEIPTHGTWLYYFIDEEGYAQSWSNMYETHRIKRRIRKNSTYEPLVQYTLHYVFLEGPSPISSKLVSIDTWDIHHSIISVFENF
jgi:hypothetical protein